MADITPELLARLARISSGTLTTQLFKRGLRQCFMVGVRPLNPAAASFAGEAFTMRFIPAREDLDRYPALSDTPDPTNLQWMAVKSVGPGQVLVIDSRNDPRAASAGNILLTRLIARGAAGVVTDGAFRDGAEIARMAIPAYARERTASTRPSFHHVADLNVPVGCAGVAVYPGDILVGDADGVTVIPRHLAAEIADAGEAQDDLENYVVQRIAAGEKLWGVYPPGAATRADYEAWKAAGGRPEDVTRIRAPGQPRDS